MMGSTEIGISCPLPIVVHQQSSVGRSPVFPESHSSPLRNAGFIHIAKAIIQRRVLFCQSQFFTLDCRAGKSMRRSATCCGGVVPRADDDAAWISTGGGSATREWTLPKPFVKTGYRPLVRPGQHIRLRRPDSLHPDDDLRPGERPRPGEERCYFGFRYSCNHYRHDYQPVGHFCNCCPRIGVAGFDHCRFGCLRCRCRRPA